MTPSPLFIVYGSATGNAEHIAKDLAATYQTLLGNPDADTFFPSVVCCELDHYKKKCQAVWDVQPEPGQVKHGVLIVTSTTGNGDAPENASRFTRYVKRKTTAASQPFKHVAYSVLGLGDTNYDQFCNTGKVVDKKMAELGATRIQPLVCADEATGLEDAVDPWAATILTKITAACRDESNSATNTTTMATTTTTPPSKASAQEEKKVEPAEDKATAPLLSTSPSIMESSSKGVAVVRALLQENPMAAVHLDRPPPVDTLPTVGAPRISSVALLKDENSIERAKSAVSTDDEEDGLFYTYNRPYMAAVKAARYLTQTSAAVAPSAADSLSQVTTALRQQFPLDGEAAERNGKRVVEITLKLPQQGFSYQPGDAIGMVVGNDTDQVAWILDLLQRHHGLAATQVVSLDDNEPLTVKQVITQQVDLTWNAICHGNKRVLYALSQQAAGDEKRVLEWLSSAAGEPMFQTYIVEQKRSVIDLMTDFCSLQTMSLQTMVGILPALAPRYYSVTSSPLVAKDCLTIALAVVDYLTPSLMIGGEEHGCRRVGGLASQYLESLTVPWISSAAAVTTLNATVPIFPKPTEDFRLPSQLETPLVLIGPGTGVAPFVGFLQHRQALAVAKDTAAAPGSVDLYFGCRHPDHDFLYQYELGALKESCVLTRLHTAFSREGVNKVYVQHVMEQHADAVRDLLLRQKSAVYICGDGNHMARAVQGALQSILQEELGDTAASDYLLQMKTDHRLLLDIWS